MSNDESKLANVQAEDDAFSRAWRTCTLYPEG